MEGSRPGINPTSRVLSFQCTMRVRYLKNMATVLKAAEAINVST